MAESKHHKGSIVPLVQLWEAFQRDQPGGDLYGFNQWMMVNKVLVGQIAPLPNDGGSGDVPPSTPTVSVNEGAIQFDNLNFAAVYLLVRVYKFLKIYTKNLMLDERISSLDEFGVLATVQETKGTTIRDLCKSMLVEFSTMAAITKRLIANGLLTERVHQDDKRAKLIELTEEGSAYFFHIIQKLQELPEVMEGLSQEEQISFLQVLNRLDNVHSRKMQT